MMRQLTVVAQWTGVVALLSLCVSPTSGAGEAAGGMAFSSEELQGLEADRLATVNHLMAIAGDRKLQQTDKESVANAMRALGALRAPEASTVLARNLLFTPRPLPPIKGTAKALWDPREVYPGGWAIEQIGIPALPALMEVIWKHPHSELARGANGRMLVILGYDLRATYIGGLLEQETDAERRAILEQLLIPSQKSRLKGD